jgi:hypothetical protein
VRKPGLLARFALDEARHGNPYPLIGRLNACLQQGALSDGELQFIVEALEAITKKHGADSLRRIEKILIAGQVEDLTNEGARQKGAVDEVMRRSGRSRRYVFNAIRNSKSKS